MRLGIVMAFLLMAGCATFMDTPEQEYVYAMARPCEGKGVRIDSIAPDGKSWRGFWAGGAYTWPEFQQCVQDHTKQEPFASWKQRNIPLSATLADAAPVAKTGPTPATAAPTPPVASPTTPTWTRGDEWSYRWSSPQGSGTYVWIVDREEVVDGVPFYVIKSGTARESYYRKDDRAFVMDKLNGQVETRNTPPATYWSTSPGTKDVRYTAGATDRTSDGGDGAHLRDRPPGIADGSGRDV